MPYDETPAGLTPWVRRLLAAMAAVYLLQLTVFTSGWLIEAFAFRPSTVLTHPWTLLTYAFLHGSFVHIAFNALTLFMFGRAVEARLGGTRFLRLYVAAALGGAALSLVLRPIAGDLPIIGASGAIYGVMLAFVLAWPDAPVLVFPIPVPVKAKWLVAFLAVMSLFPALQPGVAVFAHLGGFAGAFLYLKGPVLLRRARRDRNDGGGPPRAPAVLVRPMADGRRRADPFGPPRRRGPDATVLDEVNRVLDKISERGMDSLTPEERRFLDEMSKRFKQDS
jgi:membrane associated rhomboid family serine protease